MSQRRQRLHKSQTIFQNVYMCVYIHTHLDTTDFKAKPHPWNKSPEKQWAVITGQRTRETPQVPLVQVMEHSLQGYYVPSAILSKSSWVSHFSETRVMKIKRYKPTSVRSEEVWKMERWQERQWLNWQSWGCPQHTHLPKKMLPRSKPIHLMEHWEGNRTEKGTMKGGVRHGLKSARLPRPAPVGNRVRALQKPDWRDYGL